MGGPGWPYRDRDQAWPPPQTGRHRPDDHGRHRLATLARSWRSRRAVGVLAVAACSVAVLVAVVAGTGTTAGAPSPGADAVVAAGPDLAPPLVFDLGDAAPDLATAPPSAPLRVDRPRRVAEVVPDSTATPTTTSTTPTAGAPTSAPTSAATPTGAEGTPDPTSSAAPTTSPAPSCGPTGDDTDDTTGATT